MLTTKLIGVDCGEKETGIVVITNHGIDRGINVANESLIDFILNERQEVVKFIVVIEDVRPYNMRITDGIINTIKFMGQIEWRLKEIGIAFTLIPRWQVKQWVFLQFRTMAEPEIVKKIEYAKERKKKLNLYISKKIQTPSFVYVDDRIVQKAMRSWWMIPKPLKVGQKAAYGLKDHSWQALGLASYYIVLHKPSSLLNLTSV